MSGIAPPSSAGMAPAPGPAASRPKEERPEDAARLARLLEGDPAPPVDARRRHGERGGGSGGDGREDERPTSPDPAGLPGDAILFGLGGPPPRVEAAPSSRPAELARLVDAVADRVMVSQGAGGEAELRVTLRDEVFGQTDISIIRQGDTLAVRIATGSETLQAYGADLAQELSDRLRCRVVMEIGAGSGASGERHSRQRSRGFDDIMQYVAEQRA